jgi:hypothetical protein
MLASRWLGKLEKFNSAGLNGGSHSLSLNCGSPEITKRTLSTVQIGVALAFSQFFKILSNFPFSATDIRCKVGVCAVLTAD